MKSLFIRLVIMIFLTSHGVLFGNVTIIPSPQISSFSDKLMPLGKRIVITQDDLLPIAELVRAEVESLSGRSLKVVKGKALLGDIVLRRDSHLKRGQYEMDLQGVISIRGADVEAVTSGTASLLQLIISEGGRVSVPIGKVTDQPYRDKRVLSVSVDAQEQGAIDLMKMIDLCRLFKFQTLDLTINSLVGSKKMGLNLLEEYLEVSEFTKVVQYATSKKVALSTSKEGGTPTPYNQCFMSRVVSLSEALWNPRHTEKGVEYYQKLEKIRSSLMVAPDTLPVSAASY